MCPPFKGQIPVTERRALIALGSNMPARGARYPAETLRAALSRLRSLGRARPSRVYVTPAFPAGSGPDFVNACASLVTDLAPRALLERLHAIEAANGRRRGPRWGPRTLDLDLLAYGDAVLPSCAAWARWARLPAASQTVLAPRRLILPHPRMHERAFVLVPLADVAPDWRHPVTGRSVRAMLDALPGEDRRAIRPLD